jgi:hypothetical protein
LRDHDEVFGDDEIRAAALQFVRKISGYRQPSKKNEAAFEAAVAEIADSSHRFLHAITGPSGEKETAGIHYSRAS